MVEMNKLKQLVAYLPNQMLIGFVMYIIASSVIGGDSFVEKFIDFLPYIIVIYAILAWFDSVKRGNKK